MDLSAVSISEHALQRFQERWPGRDKCRDPRKTIKKLLKNTEEIRKKPAANVLAIIRYQRKARYFQNGDWIFVTNEEANVLFTVELKSSCPELWEKTPKKKGKKTKSG